MRVEHPIVRQAGVLPVSGMTSLQAASSFFGDFLKVHILPCPQELPATSCHAPITRELTRSRTQPPTYSTIACSLIPAVKALWARHSGYGVAAAHYRIVGEALLRMLERGLGEDFAPEVRSAWAKVGDVLATTMQAGAERSERRVEDSGGLA